MLLLLLVACPAAGQKVDTGAGGEAWSEWTDGSDGEDSPPVVVPEDDEEPDVGVCEPEACIELAEAVDRGFASIEYGVWGLQIENFGPYAICFEDWYTFLSETSQDAVAGTTLATEIEPEQRVSLPYGEWGTDTRAWWCVEHNQYTASGSRYSFDGARAPSRIGDWAQRASDVDGDGSEDHTDFDAGDGLPQTQHNAWDYIAEAPVFIVGRQMNWLEVADGGAVEVTVRVTNLGREGGSGRVSERLPPGWVASNMEPGVESQRTEADGGTTLTWTVSAAGAEEPTDTSLATWYDVVELHYRLTYTGRCAGREIGFTPTIVWADGSGGAYVSEGSPLVVQCCGADDGPDLGGDFPP
jgi:hypothetical protein